MTIILWRSCVTKLIAFDSRGRSLVVLCIPGDGQSNAWDTTGSGKMDAFDTTGDGKINGFAARTLNARGQSRVTLSLR